MSWPAFWQQEGWQARLLAPLGWLTCRIATRRLQRWQARFEPTRPDVTVVVVGNVTAGGSGKTPLIIWLAQSLQAAGIPCGIVSRGYGGRVRHDPLWVTPDTDPALAGDEPVMLARRLGVPVTVAPDRMAAVDLLCRRAPEVQVVLSDDGLQHFGLPRDFEIGVVEARRGLGNGRCLPAGPLREPAARLKTVDWRVLNGTGAPDAPALQALHFDARMHLVATACEHLAHGERRPLAQFAGEHVCAVAGIGSPQRFVDTLREAGIHIRETRLLPDHVEAKRLAEALAQCRGTVIVTEKDAVKCRHISLPPTISVWVLTVEAELPVSFRQQVVTAIQRRVEEKYEG